MSVLFSGRMGRQMRNKFFYVPDNFILMKPGAKKKMEIFIAAPVK
jgi:hypothetical protein